MKFIINEETSIEELGRCLKESNLKLVSLRFQEDEWCVIMVRTIEGGPSDWRKDTHICYGKSLSEAFNKVLNNPEECDT